jgi:pyruvate kinase
MDAQGVQVPVIAKIERCEALGRLEEIIQAFDGIMVARGDLGVETGLEHVPLIQKRAIALARRQAKPVIVATEMLLMLSAETSIGRHPVAAVATMARIICAAESAVKPEPMRDADQVRTSRREGIAIAAALLRRAVGAKALVAFTRTGDSARLLAAQRSGLPVLAFTPTPRVRSQLALVWGVETFLEPAPLDTDQIIAQVDRAMLDLGRAERGDYAVVVAGAPPGGQGSTNMVGVHGLGVE